MILVLLALMLTLSIWFVAGFKAVNAWMDGYKWWSAFWAILSIINFVLFFINIALLHDYAVAFVHGTT